MFKLNCIEARNGEKWRLKPRNVFLQPPTSKSVEGERENKTYWSLHLDAFLNSGGVWSHWRLMEPVSFGKRWHVVRVLFSPLGPRRLRDGGEWVRVRLCVCVPQVRYAAPAPALSGETEGCGNTTPSPLVYCDGSTWKDIMKLVTPWVGFKKEYRKILERQIADPMQSARGAEELFSVRPDVSGGQTIF